MRRIIERGGAANTGEKMAVSKIRKGTTNISANLPQELADELDAVAELTGRTKSEIVAEAVREKIRSGEMLAEIERRQAARAREISAIRKRVGSYGEEAAAVPKVAEKTPLKGQ